MTRSAAFGFTIVVAISTSSAFAGPLRIATEPLSGDLTAAVLEFELRGLPESRGVRLRRVPGGEEVPCQVTSRTSNGATIVWVARELKKDAETAWEVDLIPAGAAGDRRVQIKPDGENLDINVEGKLFTRLVAERDAPRPYLFPIIGPGGVGMTRQFPMHAKVEGEDQDHPHHRSLWFTHGSVAGVDFWSEGSKTGRIRQTKVVATESGPVFGKIETRNEWITPEGKKVLDDFRTLTFFPLERGESFIDLNIVLTAADGDVVFGDTKEGSFGIRLAESMKESRGGVIVNSAGQHGMKEAWGKPAEWVDYSGKVAGQHVGVAIFDHPSSFRHPTHWHVRDYGLFAANPFGYHDFYGDAAKNGSFTLEKGKSMTFHYRVFLHRGGAEDAKVREAYRAFATPARLRPKTDKA
jgi:hypothetical protein